MPAYVHGNLAVKDKEKPAEQRRAAIRPKQQTGVRKSALTAQDKLLYLFTIAVCVIVAGVILYRYAQIYQINSDMAKIERDIVKLQAENDMLKQKLQSSLKPGELQKYAEENGFAAVTDEQRVNVPRTPAADRPLALKR